jgi:hypothetical protein
MGAMAKDEAAMRALEVWNTSGPPQRASETVRPVRAAAPLGVVLEGGGDVQQALGSAWDSETQAATVGCEANRTAGVCIVKAGIAGVARCWLHRKRCGAREPQPSPKVGGAGGTRRGDGCSNACLPTKHGVAPR